MTDGGCSSTANIQAIKINALPVVDFSLPAICLNDADAQFTDKSTIADSSQSGFTWLWNFGDANATASNPNTSTLQNPTHKYSQAANYNVSLTVTSASGCMASKTQAFTVNGDTPVAAFSVENGNSLCSSDPVVFDNLSSVNFGAITKIVWYFDYNNNPQDTVVFLADSIPASGKFYHNYGLFNSPLTKSYTVRMDVYSGITCTSTAQQNITVYANPLLTLSAIGNLCQNAQPVQVVQNTNGFSGTGVFTGTGISPAGLFDPSTTGTGTFTIGYTFTAQNGCTYSTSQQVTVNPVPTVSLVPELVFLEGGQLTIPATATGDSLSYQWAPSTGLNHDNVLNPIASPANNTTYTLTVTNGHGCPVSAQVLVSVLKLPVIPNTFTPNGDGINDTWDIKYLDEYTNCTINIFDRYGQKVYTSNGYGTPWDGKYRGIDLPAGTYYYIISPGNGRKVLSGSVTIIR
jgi:gliding motility-associated-like protein